jgi:hypothetical protein
MHCSAPKSPCGYSPWITLWRVIHRTLRQTAAYIIHKYDENLDKVDDIAHEPFV